jgi:hypothetical protein
MRDNCSFLMHLTSDLLVCLAVLSRYLSGENEDYYVNLNQSSRLPVKDSNLVPSKHKIRHVCRCAKFLAQIFRLRI